MKTKYSGRGWRGYRKGKAVKSFNQIVIGKKYLEINEQFTAKNVLEVVEGDMTGLNRPIVYTQFVRPYGNEQRKIALWAHELNTTVKLWEIKGDN